MPGTPDLDLDRVDYGFVADLAAANGWRLALAIVDGDRWALRVLTPVGRSLMAGIKFPAGTDLDRAANALFRLLHEEGHA